MTAGGTPPLPRFSDQDDHSKHHDEVLKQRLDAVYESVKRTRSALLLCVLASGTMFICLWNTYASWDRDFAFLTEDDFQRVHVVREADRASAIQALRKIREATLDKPYTEDELRRACDSTPNLCLSNKAVLCAVEAWPSPEEGCPQNAASPTRVRQKQPPLYDLNGSSVDDRELRRRAWAEHVNPMPTDLHGHQMRSWVDTQVVSVALLGIKISVSDFAILGSAALFLCLFYLFLCERRENHEVGYLFQDICSNDTFLKTHGYHAVAIVSSYMVFNLGGPHEIGGGTDAVMDCLELPNHGPRRRIRGVRLISAFLDFLPSFTIAATIVSDCGWTFHWHWLENHLFVSPFRLQEEAPTPFTADTYFYFADGIALFALAVLTFMSIRIRFYENGIRKLLDKMYRRLQDAGLQSRWALQPDRPEPPKPDAQKAAKA
jgi:hypothetical protein